MNVSAAEIAQRLKERIPDEVFGIVYHIRPDGDCIGSSFALALGLMSLGARVTVLGDGKIPELHRYLTDRVELTGEQPTAYIAVDASAPERLGRYSGLRYSFCIDHHRNNSIAADYKYVVEDCGACAELVYTVLSEMGAEISPTAASLLYTAIVTDTACFRTSDTSRETLETAAALAGLGADICAIATLNAFEKSAQRLAVERRFSDSFRLSSDGRLQTGVIMRSDLAECGCDDSELEGINSMTIVLRGVRIGAALRELPDGSTRCSVRTTGDISAAELCAHFGGGGHFHAACCTFAEPPLIARELFEQYAKGALM